jgi:molecular chaperone DnaJ
VRRERTLSVRIPAGVDDGARIRLAGEGDAGARGGPRGDLYIFLSVTPHELFERDNLDLLVHRAGADDHRRPGRRDRRPLPAGRRGLRRRVQDHRHGPEGAQTGKTVRLKGKGMPSLRSRQRGDLVVELFVETPTHLTARQKELMRELAGLCGEKQNPKSANFVGKAKRFWEEVTGALDPRLAVDVLPRGAGRIERRHVGAVRFLYPIGLVLAHHGRPFRNGADRLGCRHDHSQPLGDLARSFGGRQSA